MITLELDRSPVERAEKIDLDADQQLVVAHRTGAMRVLAGPGTGKTTTLVAAMADRITGSDALRPDQVLGLTFGRRAALDWRDKVSAAVGGGSVPLVSTFHSFCYGLIRQYSTDDIFESVTRLLSGPEQQVRARQLFSDALNDGRLTWPQELTLAVGTRGLAEEIRAVMSRARTHGLDPEELSALGKQAGRPTWEALAKFMGEYLDVLDFEGVLDYSELIHRAVLIAHTEPAQSKLHDQYRAIYVDEYQDTDPGQVSLLKALVGPGASLVVVGDVDQAIYGFRGADEKALGNFAAEFEKVTGQPVQTVVLKTCRRFGKLIRDAASAVIGSRPVAGFSDPATIRNHRNPGFATDQVTDSSISLYTYDSDGASAAHIADLIARAHAERDIAWSDMAIIVRSAVNGMPQIQRALISAGIPVEIAGEDIPLHLDPAVRPLMTMLKVIDNPRELTPSIAWELITGPLVNIDPVDLRGFSKVLRKADQSADSAPRSSRLLLAEALANPGDLLTIAPGRHDNVVNAIKRLAELITETRDKISKGATPHEALWNVWQGTTWPRVLEQQALGFGLSQQRANRDLDAIISLFDLANRFVSSGRGKDLTVFISEVEVQEISGESLAENDLRHDTVRLLTAHRAKGLQWKFVVVAGVQEDLWPDFRQRQSILQSDRIGKGIELMPHTLGELLASERRLFYVAITRAMTDLVITAVDTSGKDDGTRPSRFMHDVATSTEGLAIKHISGRPARPLSSDGVIASLRRVLADDSSSPALKEVAASKLAQLAAATRSDGRPAFTAAVPTEWWGVRELTVNEVGPSEPIWLSATAVNDIEECPAKWFLTSQVNAKSDSGMQLIFGNALHRIAEGVGNGQIGTDLAEIELKIDRLWTGMGYEARWENATQRAAASDAATRLVNWLMKQRDVASVIESKLHLETKVDALDGDGNPREISIAIRGAADRIQFEADGAVIYDFKTSKDPVTRPQLPKNLQLALYAFLLDSGTYTSGGEVRRIEEGQEVAGAALIQLRSEAKGDPNLPLVQQVDPSMHDAKSEVKLTNRLGNAAAIILDERYEAITNKNCDYCPVKMLCPAQTEGQQVID